jgi:hypothetical protein
MMSQAGVGTVRMQLSETNYTEISTPANQVTVTYVPDPANNFSVAWHNYITNSLKWIENPPGTYKLPTTDTLVIKRYDIMVKGL